jgi:hypothetical protein
MPEEKDGLEPLHTLLKNLPPDQASKVLESLFALFNSSLSKMIPPLIDCHLENTGFTREIAGLVQLLAARSDDTKEGVLEKALTLYGLALDAREKGNRLAILSPDDVIVHDVVGFEPAETAHR